ncbi:MAG: STAS/SEC14 domain-containing protein [Gammaproteobacteria bacterium]
MKIKSHGLSIGIERFDERFLLTLKAIGKLTHADYEVITPMIESALESVKDPKIRALIDATQFEGWELRAAWDDFKIGLRHGSEFEKIAIYGGKNWQQMVAKIGGWFISGEVTAFEDLDAAVRWLNEE